MAPCPGTPSVTAAVCLPERQAWGPCSALHRTAIVPAWITALGSIHLKVLEKIWLSHLCFRVVVCTWRVAQNHFFQDRASLCVCLSFPLVQAVRVCGLSRPPPLDFCLVNKTSTPGLNPAAVYATCLPWCGGGGGRVDKEPVGSTSKIHFRSRSFFPPPQAPPVPTTLRCLDMSSTLLTGSLQATLLTVSQRYFS